MVRPRIGITTSFENRQQRLDYNYIEATIAAGGVPIIVPFVKTEALAEEIASQIDGLIVPGGPGITQGIIGDLPEDLQPVDPLRLQSDHLMLDACERRRLPVLGICYGMQLLSARRGGSIFADVERQIDSAIPHSSQRGGKDHPLEIVPNTCLAAILGTGTRSANTYHLQAVATPGSGLTVSARSSDGVIEAVENADGSQIGVQFHPERMGAEMLKLFRYLIQRTLGA